MQNSCDWETRYIFVRHHSDDPHKKSEADIKSELGFLVDDIYVVFGDQSSNNLLVFLWALLALPNYRFYFDMQNLFRNCNSIKTKYM
jgi:hypothetical protein